MCILYNRSITKVQEFPYLLIVAMSVDALKTCCHEANALLCIGYCFGLEWQTGMPTLQAFLLILSWQYEAFLHNDHHHTLYLKYAIPNWSTGDVLANKKVC